MLVLLSGLVSQCRLTPRSNRTYTTDTNLTFTTAVGMVIGVHYGTSDGGTDAHVALTTGLTDLDVFVVQVTNFTDGGLALDPNLSYFAGGQTQGSVFPQSYELGSRCFFFPWMKS